MSFIIWTIAISQICHLAGGDEIKLGGVRRVHGSVRVQDSEYAILVTFDRVKSLPEPLNQKINISKGRQYALRMLARHVGAEGTIRMTVPQMRLVRHGNQDDAIELQFNVPVATVTLEDASTDRKDANGDRDRKSKESDRRHAGTSQRRLEKGSVLEKRSQTDLLARVPDYFDTIDSLVHSWHAALADLKQRENNGLLQRADQECFALLQEIETDQLLLRHEKDLLMEKLTNHLEDFLGECVSADERPGEAPQAEGDEP